MSRLTHILRGLLGLRRPEPKTVIGRMLRRSAWGMKALTIVYLLLHAFPQVLFAHNFTVDGIIVYSREPLPAVAIAEIREAAARVASAELAVRGRTERVFLCDEPWLFRLFGPLQARALAYSVSITDHAFVAVEDFHSGRVRSASGRTRSLSSVVAHEITHGLIRKRIGIIRALLLPDWIAEGYCEYVARESTLGESEGLALMQASGQSDSGVYRYFLYHRMVAHLMNDRAYTFNDLLRRADDQTRVEAETRSALFEMPSPAHP
jgi:hypothetical protein